MSPVPPNTNRPPQPGLRPRLRSTPWRVAVAGLAFACAGAAQGQASDADFLAARAAFERGDRAKLAALAGPFAGQLLQPYVSYWQLKLNLDAATRDEVKGYLARWPDTPLADRLRIEWLKVVARRGDWATFALDYPPPNGEDTELACHGVTFRRLREGDAALMTAKPFWLNGQATPENCEPLFAALIQKGEITAADRRARYRLAAEAGNFRLAQSIAVELPPEDRITAREFAQVERDPARALAKGEFSLRHRGGRELALYALERAARTDATAASEAWIRYRVNLPVPDRHYGNGRLAYHAARQLAPLANDWFRDVDAATLSDIQHAWRVRAALRAGSWPDVLKAVEAMPAPQSQESAWRYWKARALAAAGRADEANAFFATLLTETNFYGLLAAEAQGRNTLPDTMRDPATNAPYVPDAAALAAYGAKPGVQRAVKLAQLGMKPESLREWIYAIRGLDDDNLLVAAEYARRQKLYDRAINTAERTVARHDFTLRYLAPYREQFGAAARDNGVEEAMLFGIARQESRFAADIVSSAGAMGLMQLMPGTARLVAKQMGRADYKASDIGDIATNTQFGAFYFKYWLDRLDRMPALAAAAYNAGPSRAQQWRAGAPLEGAIWVETIPFNETRDYVKKVLANIMFYTREFNGTYVPLTARLGTVTPRGNGSAVAARAE